MIAKLWNRSSPVKAVITTFWPRMQPEMLGNVCFPQMVLRCNTRYQFMLWRHRQFGPNEEQQVPLVNVHNWMLIKYTHWQLTAFQKPGLAEECAASGMVLLQWIDNFCWRGKHLLGHMRLILFYLTPAKTVQKRAFMLGRTAKRRRQSRHRGVVWKKSWAGQRLLTSLSRLLNTFQTSSPTPQWA